jgi:hypothetical protein
LFAKGENTPPFFCPLSRAFLIFGGLCFGLSWLAAVGWRGACLGFHRAGGYVPCAVIGGGALISIAQKTRKKTLAAVALAFLCLPLF